MLSTCRAVLLFVVFCTTPLVEGGEWPQKGWRMVDRFSGFRYELVATVEGGSGEPRKATAAEEEDFMAHAVAEADRLFGFGWMQSTVDGRFVGEFRGKGK